MITYFNTVQNICSASVLPAHSGLILNSYYTDKNVQLNGTTVKHFPNAVPRMLNKQIARLHDVYQFITTYTGTINPE